MKIDRARLIDNMGGEAAVAGMSPEARTDALEDFLVVEMTERLKNGPLPHPSTAEIDAAIETRPFRRGAGGLFVSARGGNIHRLPPMPEKPTLEDFFRLRFAALANHCMQSANLAQKNGMDEEVILACLLHDTAQALIRVDHGWWCAQLYEPYVSEKVAFAIRYHQALRFYPDASVGYSYPEIYRTLFGEDYKPEPYLEAAYKMVRNHKWYGAVRQVTVNDLYSFEEGVNPQFEQFIDIIGRHFRQPEEGLGFDNSPVAHMWRSLLMPDRPL
jgi:hypothetical protein